ncbi:MAG TPA: CRTAC1 family protein [Gemmataceae bacterium]|nr:CRTAC1 family protein [Gemmataceae bacterium]
MTRHPRPGRFLVLGLLVVILGAVSVGAWYMVSKVSLPTTRETVFEEPVVADGPAAFEDVTAVSGVDFTYRNGEDADRYTILESLGGGVALFDYDADGRLDVFLTGGGSFDGPTIRGRPSRLYRNLGGMKFEDVTAAIGLDKPLFYTHGAAVADYDKDGFPDLLVTGWGRVALYHNEPNGKGGRRFAEVSAAAGLTDTRWSSSAAWGDLDGDGLPDLYVCYYVDWSFENDPACPGTARTIERDVCPPQRFNALPHRLYRNRGDGTFADATATAPLRKDGKGLGALILDLTGDGKPDVYVANDAGNNFLYRNLGGMQFDEIGMDAGVAVDDNAMYNGSMGVDAADFDGTGRPSLWVTNFQGEFHALYRGVEPGRFRHASQAAGIGRLGQSYVGFGTAFVDYDLDGWEDLVIANGHVLRHPVGSTTAQRPVLAQNEEHSGRRQFREVPGFGGPYFRDKHVGRGLAVGDLDNDGRPDLVISHQNAPVVLLRNVSETTGKGNHWAGFSLAGKGNRDLAGTVVTLEAGGRKATRFVKGGGSYLSTNDPRVLFGLGTADKVGKLTVQWVGGAAETFEVTAVDRYGKIVEGGEKSGP